MSHMTTSVGSTLAFGTRILFHAGVADSKSRLMLSSGTVPVEETLDLATRYAPGAFVPKMPWRDPSCDDLELLTFDPGSGKSWNVANDVAVIRIPKELISPFEAMLENHGVREKCAASEYSSVSKHKSWAKTLEGISEYVANISSEKPADVIYFRLADPGHLTLTKDEFGAEGQRFAGIHIDSWDRLPLRLRHKSRNRLCINLSREARYSLFINLPLMSMFNHLGLPDPQYFFEDFRGLYLGQRFMRRCPNYPVVRLQIEPGEAYLLPTDNLVHDASTEGNRFADITLTYLGYFNARDFLLWRRQ